MGPFGMVHWDLGNGTSIAVRGTIVLLSIESGGTVSVRRIVSYCGAAGSMAVLGDVFVLSLASVVVLAYWRRGRAAGTGPIHVLVHGIASYRVLQCFARSRGNDTERYMYWYTIRIIPLGIGIGGRGGLNWGGLGQLLGAAPLGHSVCGGVTHADRWTQDGSLRPVPRWQRQTVPKKAEPKLSCRKQHRQAAVLLPCQVKLGELLIRQTGVGCVARPLFEHKGSSSMTSE